MDSQQGDFRERVNYQLKPTFEERVTSYFRDLFLFPLQIDVVILEDQEYSEVIDESSMAELHKAENEEEEKPTSLSEEVEQPPHKIYVREIGQRTDLTAVMREFLRAHYPKTADKKIKESTAIFENAFRCYDKLFDERSLRDFFVDVCKENDTLLRMADLPHRL